MKSLSRISAVVVGVLILSSGLAIAQDLTIGNRTLISSTRVGRTLFEYTYKAEVINSGPAVQNVTATLTSNSPNTTVVDGELSFGDAASGATVTSSDTFTIKQNRLYPLNWSDLVWDTQYNIPEGTTGWIGPSGGTVTDPGGASAYFPPGALSVERLISIQTKLESASYSVLTPPLFIGGGSFSPDGAVFQQPVTITMPLTVNLPPGLEFSLVSYDDLSGAWLLTESFAVVNPDGVSASAQVTHFTDYVVIGLSAAELAKFRQDIEQCNANELQVVEDFFARWINAFPLNEKFLKEYCTFCGFGNRGYACYEFVGLQIDFNYSVGIPDPNYDFDPNNPPPGDVGWKSKADFSIPDFQYGEEGTFAFLMHVDGDTRFSDTKIPGCEFQKVYRMIITVHIKCTNPDLSVQPEKYSMHVGEKIKVGAELICGGEGMENQQVDFSVVDGPGQLVGDTSKTTSSDGKAEIALLAYDIGTIRLSAIYEACKGQEQPIPTPLMVQKNIEVEGCPNYWLEIRPPSAYLTVNKEEILQAFLHDESGSEVPLDTSLLSWSGEPENIIEAYPAGRQVLISGIKPGTATVTATYTDPDDCKWIWTAPVQVVPLYCAEEHDVYDEWTDTTLRIVYENISGYREILAEHALATPDEDGVADLEGFDSICDASGELHVVYALEYDSPGVPNQTWHRYSGESGWTSELLEGIYGSSLSLTFDANDNLELVYGEAIGESTWNINYFNRGTLERVTLATHPEVSYCETHCYWLDKDCNWERICWYWFSPYTWWKSVYFPIYCEDWEWKCEPIEPPKLQCSENCEYYPDFEDLQSVREATGALRIEYTLEEAPGSWQTYTIYR